MKKVYLVSLTWNFHGRNSQMILVAYFGEFVFWQCAGNSGKIPACDIILGTSSEYASKVLGIFLVKERKRGTHYVSVIANIFVSFDFTCELRV